MPLLLLSILVLAAKIIGARSLDVGTDTENYAELYRVIGGCMCLHEGFEPGFQYLTLMIAGLGFGTEFYFSAISLTLWALYMAYVTQLTQGSTLSKQDRSVLFYSIASALLCSPFFLSSHINILRQGIASVLLYMATLGFLRKQWTWFAISSALACAFHFSSGLYVLPCFLLALSFRRLVIFVFAGSVLYISGVTQIIVVFLAEQLGLSFLNAMLTYGAESEYQGGIRLDFLLFTWCAFGVMYALSRLVSESNLRIFIRENLKVYLVLMVPFVAFGYVGYSDRYLYPAWIFMSVILGLILFSSGRFRRFSKVILPIFLTLAMGSFLLPAIA
ncbi:EpsG family protein [Massilia sp. Dwa41.01b]|uniref:EpsG family protein n=1 Tax=unclassified Massilia TaxID=2609279 RepID=UPI001600F2F9|nr:MULTISPECIES: EpsG family protein [unclassified Massilia]QNA89671.1 EpsG family protein [Massilia sp. Dwa41.01b]QNB00566.1 EpsG family protein [Massilia sp. Se16.2.3]